MAHQPGWIELYDALDNDLVAEPSLVGKCKNSRSSIGETMLHWYSIEGAPQVLEKLIALGFEINVQNEFGNTPIMECSQIGRWDNAKVLIDAGASLAIRNENDDDYFEYLADYGIEIPEWIKNVT